MKQNLPCIQILLFLVLQGTLNLSFEPAKAEIPWGPAKDIHSDDFCARSMWTEFSLANYTTVKFKDP